MIFVATWCSSCATVAHHCAFDVAFAMNTADIFSLLSEMAMPLFFVFSICMDFAMFLVVMPKESMMASSSS